ncbi:hypothetical protein F4X88_14390 [Candidatus Poribacteria bacterium]|nr:hypothetical protein [Candidatus Poribacteria bacterium]MYA57479.1 hypothetical protein [Candidatus Poribacteria bacterium]
MLLKKFWIPVLLVLIGVAIGVTFWGYQHVASQAPVKIINPVTADPVDTSKPATPKPPPPGETAESGHWHGQEWHADAHTPGEQSSVAETDSGETWRDGVWYPENYTQADIAADLAGRGAVTDEEYDRRAYKYAVNAYIQKHKKEYPDCTEDQAVIDDAKRFAEWRLADQAITDKYSELTAEHDYLMKQLE